MSSLATGRASNRSISRPARTFFVAWLLFAAMSTLWTLATPTAAAPDEPAHLIKAASVVRGEWVGEYSPRGHVVHVPRYIGTTHQQTCYAFHSETTADCIAVPPGNPSDLIASTTTAGLYNPLYYVLVGWPSLIFNDASGIFAMRIVSGVLSTAFLAASVVLVRTMRFPRLMTAAVAVAATPMVFFLMGTVNPNAIEATTVLCFFVAVMALVSSPTRTRIGWIVLPLALSFAVAANTRGLSLLWLAIAGVCPLLLLSLKELGALFRRPWILIFLGSAVVTAGLALLWLSFSNSLGSVTIDAEPGFAHPGTGRSFLYGFTRVLENGFQYGEGIIGIFGWLDTPAPSFVYFLWAALSGALLLAALVATRRRGLLFLTALAVSFLLAPALIQGAAIESTGIIWQGRYNIPLYLCLIVGGAAILAPAATRWSTRIHGRLIRIVLTALVVGQTYAFATGLRRYSVGTDGSWLTTFIGSPWQAPGGNALLCVLVVATTATAALLIAHPSRHIDGLAPETRVEGRRIVDRIDTDGMASWTRAYVD